MAAVNERRGGSVAPAARTLEARFENFDGHRSLVVAWRPARPRAQVLFVPAFGDEMNQMRRMVKLAAEAFAERGLASFVFDLLGTGDSSGGFGEATVDAWLGDCSRAIARLREHEDLPLVLVGCRLGVALAVQASRALQVPLAGLVGWAPLLQGRAQLSGLLRLDRVARLQRPDTAGPEPRALWQAGEAAWLGGYPISAALARQLEALDASQAPRSAGAVLLDLRPAAEGQAPVAGELLARRAAEWTAQGVPTTVRAIAGPGFWNVADLVDVPELVAASVDAVERLLAPDGRAGAAGATARPAEVKP